MLDFILNSLVIPIIVGVAVQMFSRWLNKKNNKK
ncbi:MULTISPECIES: type I toxin-antitoxin system Fst family toxin [Lactococcus]|nr:MULTISPECIES: type I toxin-antitoxin system Fst family toxin [Lactococcus]